MDKKTALAAFLTILFFGGITAGGVFMFLNPSRDDGPKPSGGMFPNATAGPSSEKPMAAPADWGAKAAPMPAVRGRVPSKSGGGSLGFIQKDESFIGDGKKDPLSSEAQAAKEGDAKALVEALAKGREKESGSLSDRAIRSIMQKVVDAVHERQPRWYKQFLYSKNLKAIADRYDKDNDFDGFVRRLSKSKPFKKMLKSKSKNPEMKELTWSIIADREIGPSLKQIITEKKDDPNLMGLLKNYGQGAGVPPDMLEAAGVMLKAKKQKTKRRSAGRTRPTLRKRGFGGYDNKSASKPSGKSDSGETAQELPAGVTPEMVEKYKKYMKK